MKSKPLAILLSVVIAFTLWMYVVTVERPGSESEYRDIPVILDGENILTDKSLMLMMDTVPTVDVTLAGNRSQLNNISSANLTVIADLSRISEPGEYKLTYTVTPPGNLAVTVQDSSPQMVTVNVVKRISKDVPVNVTYEGNLPADIIRVQDGLTLDYPEINVEGPQEIVDRIASASITVDLTDRTETFVEHPRYVLCDAEGNPVDAAWIVTNTETVRVEVKLATVKKVPLVVELTDGGGAAKSTTNVEIEPKEITISGSATALADVNEILLDTFDLATITEDTTFTVEIPLPESFKNESGITTATVKITFPELSTKKFTVTDIVTRNVAEGMVAEVLTQQLEITVRGPSDQVNKLRLEDISVVLDLKDVVNTESVVPAITFGKDFPDVGVLGSYSVSVTVQEPVDAEPDTTEE